MNIQWWCSATGEAWSWGWRAYPGVWIAVVAFGVLVWRGIEAGAPTWRRALGAAAVALLWVALDWPIGPLGAGYLASVHAVQFILLAILVPPLALLAVDRARLGGWVERSIVRRGLAAFLSQPVVAGVSFTIVMGVTHVPGVVDTLMATQAGAFALDALWLAAGVQLWWPVLVRAPRREWFTPPVQMLYIFLATQGHLLIAMWLLTARFPVYGIYELAPRAIPLGALDDQQVAGGVMIAATMPIVFGALTILFFRWVRQTESDASA